MPRISFSSDYAHTAHPDVLAAIQASADSGAAYPGYGLDDECAAAASAIRDTLSTPDAEVHFVTGGTQANALVISSLLRPWEGVLSPDTGHIAEHETGAVERTGHEVLTLPNTDGKINAGQVDDAYRTWATSGLTEHLTNPKMVYVSQPTELGTLYTSRELEAIRAVCDEHGLYLFVDGARLAYASAAPGNDLTLADIARLADVLYLGGTKCGALFGEAIALPRPEIFGPLHLRAAMKQSGALLAKGWLLGVQFRALFEDRSVGEDGSPLENGASGRLYDRLGAEAIRQAQRISDGATAAGIPHGSPSTTNQRFLLLTDAQFEWLDQRYVTTPFGRAADSSGRQIVRFVTSWATREQDVDRLVADLPRLARV